MQLGPPIQDSDLSHLSEPERRRLWWRRIAVNSIFVAAWFSFSALLLLYNKAIVSKDYFAFPYPLFGTAFQMPIQFALACVFRYGWPQYFKPEQNPSPRDYVTKVMPTAVATGLDIGLGNLALKLIELSLYTMVKSSALIFVLGFAFLFKLEKFSWRLIGVIMLIAFGVFLMTFHTTSAVAWSGIALVLTSSLLAGFRWSFTQLLLKRSDVGLDNPAATIFWLSPIMGFTVALFSLPVDNWANVFASDFFATSSAAAKTCLMLGIPGVLAFCMVLSEFELLRRSGIVTTSIVGIFKEIATIMLSSWVFGDQLTPLKITGVGVTFCGIAIYSWHKYNKSVVKAAAGSPGRNSVDDEEGYALVHGDDEEGYGRVRGENEVFALEDSDSDEERGGGKGKRRAEGGEPNADQQTDAGDSLLDRHDGDEDARSVRTIGSVARKWRDR